VVYAVNRGIETLAWPQRENRVTERMWCRPVTMMCNGDDANRRGNRDHRRHDQDQDEPAPAARGA
jgi:hypothetical protein